MSVRTALLPAAGLGTRMRPVTLAVPKELLPIGPFPALHLVVEEARRAGLDRIGIVVGPGKELIRSYVEAASSQGAFPGVTFEYVSQERPSGLADALLAARPFLGEAPFALLLPDNLPLAPDYRLADLLDLFHERGRDVVGVLELGSDASGRYGNCGLFEGRDAGPGVLEITRLRDKEPGVLEIAPGATVRRTCGRYVCSPRLLQELARLRPSLDGEPDEVPAYQRIAAGGGLLGRLLPGPLFDVGNPSGYLAAAVYVHGRGGSE